MQINNNSMAQAVIQTNSSALNSHNTPSPTNSEQSSKAVTIPETPNTGEKLETYIDIKKTQAKYQVASDIMNIGSGSDKGISPVTAAYLSHNEDAREMALQHKTMQQQYENIQTYSEQQERYQNSWVV